MKRVAVFGNAGAGKSTVARRLSELTGLPLHAIDLMAWQAGKSVPKAQLEQAHGRLLLQEQWIIDDYGSTEFDVATVRTGGHPRLRRFAALSALRAGNKAFDQGLFATPPGWPEGCPVWESSLSSYRVIPRCHRYLTPKYRSLVAISKSAKRVHHLRSAREVQAFLEAAEREMAYSRVRTFNPDGGGSVSSASSVGQGGSR
jgi:hypothetical protein